MKFPMTGWLVLVLGLMIPLAMAESKSYKFDLDLDGVVGGKYLRSASYRVVVKCGEDGKGTVSFYDGSRLAAQVPCKMVQTDDAAGFYGVTYGKTADGRKALSTVFLKGEKE